MSNIILTSNPFAVWQKYANERGVPLQEQSISFSKLLFLLDFFIEAYPLIVDGELDKEDEAFFIEETKKELTAQAKNLSGRYEFLEEDPLDFDSVDFLTQEVVDFSIEQIKFIAQNFSTWSEPFLSAYAGLVAAMMEFAVARDKLYQLPDNDKEELSIRLLLDNNPKDRSEIIITGMLKFFTSYGNPETDEDIDRLMQSLFDNNVFEFEKPMTNYPFQELEDFHFSPVEVARHLWLNKFITQIPHKLHKEHKKIVRELLLRFGVDPKRNIEVFASL